MRTIRIQRKSPAASDRPSAGDPVEALGLLVAGVAKSWREELDRRLHPLGLTRVQWQALLWLDRAGGELVQGELAERLDIGAPATVALVDRMQRDGLVVRREVARDRRLKAVVVTARARALQERIRRTALTLRREVHATLSDAELETLCGLLARVRAGLEALKR